VVTFDNSNNIVRLFVDGVQIDSLSTTSNPDNTGNKPLRIAGNSQSLTEDFFIDQLDEVGVWNRALTNTEINNLMKDGFFATSGLVFINSFDNLPIPEICGDGIDNDGDILIDEGCPQPLPQLNFKFVYKFGTKGNGNGQFQDPHDVSFDSSGNVFVPDRIRNDIQKFTHEGMFLSKFGGPGSAPGQFNVPYSIAHDSNNNIYVSDRENNRIQKLSNDGVFITDLKSINGKNFVMPEDLAFDFTNGDLYITDTGNNRIVKLDKNLNFILQWGSLGTGDGQFDHPHAIDVGPDRNVYVSSGFQPYIQKFDPNGNFIKKWGKEGSGDGEMLMFLEHLDVDSEGRLFLINNNIRPVVQVWDSEGNYLTKFGSEKEGSADGQLAEPEHVTVDNDGKPFIVDSGNFRIQVFTPEVVNSQQLPQAQEICNSGIDDDGDGLVDIADPDCQQDFLSRLPSIVNPFDLQ
jgi:DNA-binding beta-propeller fold protein YncE